MTDQAATDWQNWHLIERKARSEAEDKWHICYDHPSQWDHQNYRYRSRGLSPVAMLFRELKQAKRDGEAVIFSQENAAVITGYLKRSRVL